MSKTKKTTTDRADEKVRNAWDRRYHQSLMKAMKALHAIEIEAGFSYGREKRCVRTMATIATRALNEIRNAHKKLIRKTGGAA